MVAIVVNRSDAGENRPANYAINRVGWKSRRRHGGVILVKPDRLRNASPAAPNRMNFDLCRRRLTVRYDEIASRKLPWRAIRGERQIRELIGRRQAGWGCGEILPTAQAGSRPRGSFPLQ